MNLIRACFLFMAVLMPTTWTIAHAADPAPDAAGGDMKKSSKKKSKKKDKGGDMGGGDMGGDKK